MQILLEHPNHSGTAPGESDICPSKRSRSPGFASARQPFKKNVISVPCRVFNFLGPDLAPVDKNVWRRYCKDSPLVMVLYFIFILFEIHIYAMLIKT